ncbi:uncharacterized protein [Rutidosis leptorrhynchoides]|uniref:uncharacterized protein n=1 Tax=Rutidosis leptorrhynchoides TaxID=125765 RepID=UPI003A9903DE
MGKNSGGKKDKNDQKTAPRVLRSRIIDVDPKTGLVDTSKIASMESESDGPTESKGDLSVNKSSRDNNREDASFDLNKDTQGEDNNLSIHTVVDESEADEAIDGNANQGSLNKLDGSGNKNKHSYLHATMGTMSDKKINFRFIEQQQADDEVDVVLPIESVLEAADRYSNTLVGYFLGNRLPFPVVQQYVKNTWSRFGLEKVMMNGKGIFFFKFASEQGLISVLEGGPWMIRNAPIILNKWSPRHVLAKEDVTKIPVWVNLYNVPLAGFTEVGLSMIASKIGIPMRLDSYTSTMCLESWGRPNFARAMIEISAHDDLKDKIRVATPCVKGGEKTVSEVTIEYEWKPPRCSCCCVFGHRDQQCPKIIVAAPETVAATNDGFKQVGRAKINDKMKSQARVKFGVQRKGKGTFVYRPKPKQDIVFERKSDVPTCTGKKRETTLNNLFGILNDCNEDGGMRNADCNQNEQDDVEDDTNETAVYASAKNIYEGASTPGLNVLNESHVVIGKLNGICNSVFPSWIWSSNNSVCARGTRIIIGWDPGEVQIMFIAMSDQAVHCHVRTTRDGNEFFMSFIYANNYYISRRPLWLELDMHNLFVGNRPWVILGDFNVALCLDDYSSGPSSSTMAMREFKECIDKIKMVDVNYSGMQYTWNQRPQSNAGLLKKIDRVMANDIFIDRFTDAHVIFQPYRISDHCPAILKISRSVVSKPKPFKFTNLISEHTDFLQVVENGWKLEVMGHPMFRVVKRLRLLKKPIRKLMWEKGNLHANVVKLRQELDDKSKVEWLRVGDCNSSYFHKVVKGRIYRAKIHTIESSDGVMLEGQDVPQRFLDHYINFLGNASPCEDIPDREDLFTKKIQRTKASTMVRNITDEEIKAAMFDIGDIRSPGPDGFSSTFFKSSWDIIGNDITHAIKDFFMTGQLLKEINHTVIALLPKVPSPSKVTDFRPISCCNVLYKCISKVITNRIKSSLEDVVNLNQSAFVPGRRIADNILLTQEIMKNYHLNRGVPRCAFKVDIQKAYDTVDWGFLRSTLVGFGFPKRMIGWIMKCVTTTSFSISINGDMHGYFKGKRGLRQGDPMSPYLFTLVMEVLSLMLARKVAVTDGFQYHPKCDKLKIINLCFADDLFLFAYANIDSVKVIRDVLEDFKNCSGLHPSLPKSTAFFANVSSTIKCEILDLLPFEEGCLPVRYLGVPLVSTRLLYQDCKVLVERVKSKVKDWKNKFLSIGGRVQLITSVLTSMQVYWCSIFILPDAIIKDIEKVIRGFLWCQGDLKKGKAKVKWEDLCLPKNEGGLGIKRLKFWNVALITSHVWRILKNEESLWVKWIHAYHLSTRNFWDVPVKADISWSEVISWRDIFQAGFNTNTLLCNIVDQNQWAWPITWVSKYPALQQIEIPVFSDTSDVLQWKAQDGKLSYFSVSTAYESIRPCAPLVEWFDVVWFSQCIPRHAFVLWMLIRERMKTQDRLKLWEIRDNQVLLCSLCSSCADSHSHLFFDCKYSHEVWLRVKDLILAPSWSTDWKTFTLIITPYASKKSANMVVTKLLFAATVYFVWQERNNRMFKGRKRSTDALFREIYATVRLKLMSVRFKESRQVNELKMAWNIG